MEIKNQWMEGSPEQCNAPRSFAPGPLLSSFGGIGYLATLRGYEGAEAPSPLVTSSCLKDCPFPLACYSFKLHVRWTQYDAFLRGDGGPCGLFGRQAVTREHVAAASKLNRVGDF